MVTQENASYRSYLGQSLSDSYDQYLKTLAIISIVWSYGKIPYKVKLWKFHCCTIKKSTTYFGIFPQTQVDPIRTTDSESAWLKTYILTIRSSKTVQDWFHYVYPNNLFIWEKYVFRRAGRSCRVPIDLVSELCIGNVGNIYSEIKFMGKLQLPSNRKGWRVDRQVAGRQLAAITRLASVVS